MEIKAMRVIRALFALLLLAMPTLAYAQPHSFGGKIANPIQQFTGNPFSFTTSDASTLGCSGATQWWCSTLFATGAITGSNTGNLNAFTTNDRMSSTVNIGTFAFIDNIADNGNTASGPRVGLYVNQIVPSGGTYTLAGINSDVVMNEWVNNNESGSSGLYQGAHNVLNEVCWFQGSSTFVESCSGNEIDMRNDSASANAMTELLLVEMSTVELQLGPDRGIVYSAVSGSPGLGLAISFGDPASGVFPIATYGTTIKASANVNTVSPVLATAENWSAATFHGCEHKGPFVYDCPLQASGITGATRLTTDGGSAIGFVDSVTVTNKGSGYTSYPTVTPTGCSAVLHPDLGLGGVVSVVGVYTQATNCPSNTTIAITGGGGSSATAKPVISGNSLNFPISDAIDAACRIVGSDTAGDAVAWSLEFGATQGTTPGSTAIVGSPAWSQVFATAGAGAKITLAAPSADTTLGAINITITPTSGTWNVGGSCHVTHTLQQ